jgi:hypothetical protein
MPTQIIRQLDDGVVLNDESQLLLGEPLEHGSRFRQLAIAIP